MGCCIDQDRLPKPSYTGTHRASCAARRFTRDTRDGHVLGVRRREFLTYMYALLSMRNSVSLAASHTLLCTWDRHCPTLGSAQCPASILLNSPAAPSKTCGIVHRGMMRKFFWDLNHSRAVTALISEERDKARGFLNVPPEADNGSAAGFSQEYRRA